VVRATHRRSLIFSGDEHGASLGLLILTPEWCWPRKGAWRRHPWPSRRLFSGV
jgi:hypothetical protein